MTDGSASSAAAVRGSPAPDGGRLDGAALDLVRALCQELLLDGVKYCHWKSNDALHLSATGVNDLDLLVDRAHAATFVGILVRLGFKEVKPPRRRQFPGVFHYYGLDAPTGTFVHVDAQYTLQVGDDTTKNVRLPIERAYLASAEQKSLFVVPAPEFELAVYALRLALKHGTWDAAMFGLAGLSRSERRELGHLGEVVDPERLQRVVESHLPGVGWDRWSAYVQVLLRRSPLPVRLAAGRRLVSTLDVWARRPPALDTAVRCARRVSWGVRHFVFGQRATKSLARGGAVIAVVGGDGAGKTTAVNGLTAWLGGPFHVRKLHLGKPRRSPATLVVKGAIALGRRLGAVRPPWLPNYPTPAEHQHGFPGYPWLLWQLVTARDRRRQHARARRLAARGHLVVCDRYPLAQITLMDGSRTRWIPRQALSGVANRLIDLEQRCYAEMALPDVLVVLRVEPEAAVERKRGVDDESFVRPRSAEVFAADWSKSDAVVVDASRSSADVLAMVRSAVWERL